MLKEIKQSIDLSLWDRDYTVVHKFTFDCKGMSLEQIIEQTDFFLRQWRERYPAWVTTQVFRTRPSRFVGTVNLNFVEKWVGTKARN